MYSEMIRVSDHFNFYDGNETEKALLKFLIDTNKKKYEELNKKEVEILYWSPFSNNKRTTTVVKIDEKITVISKGPKFDQFKEICNFTDSEYIKKFIGQHTFGNSKCVFIAYKVID